MSFSRTGFGKVFSLVRGLGGQRGPQGDPASITSSSSKLGTIVGNKGLSRQRSLRSRGGEKNPPIPAIGMMAPRPSPHLRLPAPDFQPSSGMSGNRVQEDGGGGGVWGDGCKRAEPGMAKSL